MHVDHLHARGVLFSSHVCLPSVKHRCSRSWYLDAPSTESPLDVALDEAT